jgi:hypothetical protein
MSDLWLKIKDVHIDTNLNYLKVSARTNYMN